MTTSLVATILLMYRKGISVDNLLKRVQWLYDEVKARKGETTLGINPTVLLVQSSLSYLKDNIIVNRDIVAP